MPDLSVLFQPQVMVAFITAVLGPVLLVLVDDKRAKRVAEERVKATTRHAAGSNDATMVGLRALMDWSARQLGENRTLAEKVARLTESMSEMELRLANAEATIALQQQHIAVLISQVEQLGGVPFRPA